ncbi:MAG: ribulose-phosphate 3-epimerase [Thermoleophilia bacterium]
MTVPTPAILPSVMSADMLALGAQLGALTDAGARVFHVDVMDGHFVPNLTVGPDFTAAVARAVRPAGALVDVHLMVRHPGPLLELFAPHADAISVHAESDEHVHRLLAEIRRLGCMAGLAVNPGTPVAFAAELADSVDYVNCMSVNPGFAGQSFIPTTPAKLARLRDALPDRVLLEVDGGIGPATVGDAHAAGARWLVSASAIFGRPDPVDAYRQLAAAVA